MASKKQRPILFVVGIACLAAADAMAAEVYHGSRHPWSASDVERLVLLANFVGANVWLIVKTHYSLLAFGAVTAAFGAHIAVRRNSDRGAIEIALPLIGKVSARGAAGFGVITAGLIIILYAFSKGPPLSP